jgi:hypothetical protein
MSKSSLKQLVLNQLPNNTQQLIKPVNVRTVENAVIDESLNVKDGGFVVEIQAGYKTEGVAITDPKAWITKKYLEENASSLPFTEEIIGDGNTANDTRIIVHGKNNSRPQIQLWYEYNTGQWRQLDVTQGITTQNATPNQLSVNLIAYEGNQTSNKYSIIVQ